MRSFIIILCTATTLTMPVFASETAQSQPGGQPSAPDPTCGPIVPFLRSDFTEVTLFECPTADNLLKTQGALLSYKYDDFKKQSSGSLDGVGGFVYRYIPTDAAVFRGIMFGPYVQGDGTYGFQSPYSSTANPIETLTTGAFVEFGMQDFATDSSHYFRIRGGQVSSNSGLSAATFTGEWIPAFNIGNFNVGTPYNLGKAFVELDPEVMIQYDEYTSGPRTYLLFQSHTQALRVGPEALVKFYTNKSEDGNDPFTKNILNKLLLTLTCHVSRDVDSDRNFLWTQAALTYSFGPENSFGATVSYGLGNLEMSGTWVNQIKAGLSVKF
jgi:hypothetical protein